MFNERNNPFKLSNKEQLIEAVGIILFMATFLGSALKLLFL